MLSKSGLPFVAGSLLLDACSNPDARRMLILAAAWLALLSSGPGVLAQLPETPAADEATSEREPDPMPLDVKVLMEASPKYSLMAQSWTRVFQDVGYGVVFDSGRTTDRTGIEDVTFRNRRSVRVVGELDSSGAIHFGDRTFRQTEPKELKLFLQQLARYGAKGPPQDSPTWGLTDDQFKVVVQTLSAPVTAPIPLSSPVEAVEALQLPQMFQLKYTPAARRRALMSTDSATAIELHGISGGTATAIVLAQFGLGFRPMASPSGGYVLEIDVGDESSNLWPVGWKSTEALTRTVPKIYKSQDVNLEDAEVPPLIELVASRLEIPSFAATHALEAKGIRLSELTYSRKPDKLSPSSLLRKLGDKFGMGLEIRVDETAKPFLWTTTAEQNNAFRTRFAHVKPK